jgi:hypothetical protein
MKRLPLLLSLSLASVACGGDEDESAQTESAQTESAQTESAQTESAQTEPTRPEATPHAGIDLDDPSACAACHGAVVEEWRTSMHARAHHEADPIYGGMRRFRMGREGEQLASRCAQCHGPREPDRPDGAVARTGVGCAACHAVEAIDRGDGARMGARAFTYADATLRGPHDVAADAPAPHGTGAAAPWIADGRTLCLTCHDAMENPQGAATCTTGAEYAEGGTEATCTSCHMPEVEGPSGAVSSRASHRSHAFLGPHHLWREGDDGSAFLATAITATPSLEGRRLRLALHNETGHAMPTGFPGRMVLVRATGYDAAGEAVWRSFEDDPMAEDPDAVLNKVYVDAEGEPTMPPYGAELARDTRLRPGETRPLEWTVPEGVVRAEIQLLFRLLPPPAARRVGVEDTPLAEARPFLTVSVP